MAEWWNGMILFEQIMISIAIPATIVLIIQLILLFVGMGAARRPWAGRSSSSTK